MGRRGKLLSIEMCPASRKAPTYLIPEVELLESADVLSQSISFVLATMYSLSLGNLQSSQTRLKLSKMEDSVGRSKTAAATCFRVGKFCRKTEEQFSFGEEQPTST